MCLGVPGKIVEITQNDLRTGKVAFGGIIRDVCLEYVPEADVGDWVIALGGERSVPQAEALGHTQWVRCS